MFLLLFNQCNQCYSEYHCNGIFKVLTTLFLKVRFLPLEMLDHKAFTFPFPKILKNYSPKVKSICIKTWKCSLAYSLRRNYVSKISEEIVNGYHFIVYFFDNQSYTCNIYFFNVFWMYHSDSSWSVIYDILSQHKLRC